MKKIKDLFEAEASSPTETAMLYNGAVGFRIPDYQREYDWSEDNIKRLIYDCLNGFHRLATSPNADAFTFLGTLILVEEKTKEEDFAGTSVAIVDGQQRLTTLTLLACALYESLHRGIAKLGDAELDEGVRRWLESEVEDRLAELLECAVGLQKIKGRKTFPYPRIVRSMDERGRSAQTSEYRSPLGKFLESFGDFASEEADEFVPPKLGQKPDAIKLGANFKLIRELVAKINDADWYEDTECEQVSLDWIVRSGYKGLFDRLDDFYHDDGERNRALDALIKNPKAHDIVRSLLFAAYFSRCVVLTRVTTSDESAAFDIFDALNTTGEPLTALETLKPRVIAYENAQGGYSGSASDTAFMRLREHIDDQFEETSKKQSETKDLVVSFALYIEGSKQPEHLAAQRNFLRTRYDKATVSRQNAQRFVEALADLAEFRRYYWTPSGIEELGHFHPLSDVGQVQLLMSFVRDMKTKLALPILARYWNPDLKNAGSADFLAALKAVTAFLVLRRAASGGTGGIDSDFRGVMAPSTGPGSSKKFGLSAGVDAAAPPLPIDDLKKAFRKLLSASKQKVTDKDKWVGQVIDNPLYQQSRELVRFILLAAAHQALPDAANPGCWKKEGVKLNAQNSFLNYETWQGELYESVEHVAPESEQKTGWDEDIYKNTILRHSLGNLVLLPKKENGAIGNNAWTQKRIFYRALTEPTAEKQHERVEEAAASGVRFSNYTKELLQSGQRLPLLDPLRDVEKWDRSIIEARGRNTASLAWDYFWPWLN
jgi:hypothetical protein